MANEEIGGYRFSDPALLEMALTHSSYRHEHPDKDVPDFERLEFLGDAVVDLVIAHFLYDLFPDASEGELTPRRAQLVSGAPLARVARTLGLPDLARLGHGENSSPRGRQRVGLGASLYESVVGAVYVDGGFGAAKDFILRTMAELIAEALGTPSSSPKTILNEKAFARDLERPVYELIETIGPSHGPRFVIEVRSGGRAARGAGMSKQEAQEAAAAALLEQLGD